MVLAVDRVTLEFEGLRALSEVSFGVEEATLTALVGPNGAGKTSLLNCVSGFYAPTRGGISFRRRRISGEPPHRVAACGIFTVARSGWRRSGLHSCTVPSCAAVASRPCVV